MFFPPVLTPTSSGIRRKKPLLRRRIRRIPQHPNLPAQGHEVGLLRGDLGPDLTGAGTPSQTVRGGGQSNESQD